MKKIIIKSEYSNKYGGIDIELNNLEQNEKNNRNILLSIFFGMIIGFVNGFWGGGGGMICVPILSNIFKLPEKKSHATTLFIMLPMSIISLIIYFIKGNLNFVNGYKVGLGFIFGGVLGAFLLKKINNFILGIIFSVLIIIGGVKMII